MQQLSWILKMRDAQIRTMLFIIMITALGNVYGYGLRTWICIVHKESTNIKKKIFFYLCEDKRNEKKYVQATKVSVTAIIPHAAH